MYLSMKHALTPPLNNDSVLLFKTQKATVCDARLSVIILITNL